MLLGLSGGGGGSVVLRGLSCRGIRYVSSIAGTLRGGGIFASSAGWVVIGNWLVSGGSFRGAAASLLLRGAGWCLGVDWSLGVAFAGRGLLARWSGGQSYHQLYDINSFLLFMLLTVGIN